MQGGNADNKEHKQKVRRKILDSYGYGGKPDRRFVGQDIVFDWRGFNDFDWYNKAFRKRKPKETK